jgi:hypothetical protein
MDPTAYLGIVAERKIAANAWHQTPSHKPAAHHFTVLYNYLLKTDMNFSD